VLRYAAEELRDHVAQLTGVELPVTTDDVPCPAQAVLLGATRYTPMLDGAAPGLDGFRIAVREPHLVIVSPRERGVLYGVYALLERFGCRWYASWCAKIPRRECLTVPADLDVAETPAFEMREPYWYDVKFHPEFAARLRVNSRSRIEMPAKFGGNEFRFGGGLVSCHTFNTLMPPDEFFDDHPEYYSFEDGARRKHPTQLCLTNPDVLRIVTERVLERIRKDPGAKFYGVSQNDWPHYCQCPACAAIDAEEESQAGSLVRFINAVAEAVEKEFPDVLIETLAYMYTRKPPKKTRLRHNVVPCLCTWECDFALPLEESRYPQNVAFCSDLRGWGRQTDHLYIWNYSTNFSRYPWPFANVLTLQDNLRFFLANGAKFIFDQGAFQGRHGDFAELKAWLVSRWMWNPDLPIEPLLDDFFNGYYGKAAPFVRTYFDELHQNQRAWSEGAADRPLRIYDGPENPAIPAGFYERAKDLWAQAAAAVEDDPVASYNVRMGAFSLDYWRFDFLREKHDRALMLYATDDIRAVFPEMHTLAKSLAERFDEAGNIRLCEWRANEFAVETMRRYAEATEPPVSKDGIIPGSRVHIRKRRAWGDYETDPGTGVEVLKVLGKNAEPCVEMPSNWIAYEPGARYHVRFRLRIEPAARSGEAFRAGLGDYHGGQEREMLVRQLGETSEDYAWYDFGEVELNEREFLWLAPGRPDEKGEYPVNAIWLAGIEFRRV